MAISPFSDPIIGPLLGDDEIAEFFAADVVLSAMLRVEAALAWAEADHGVIPGNAGEAIVEAIGRFIPDIHALGEATESDGVAVPELVRQLRAEVGEEFSEFVHFGSTSQDIVDNGLAVRLRSVLDVLAERIDDLVGQLKVLDDRDGATAVMAHTRMQRAIPVTASRIIESWKKPLERYRARLGAVREAVCVVSFAGAAGTLDRFGDNGAKIRRALAGELELGVPDGIPHSERDAPVQLASWLAGVSGALGKIGQDIALHAQNELGSVSIKEGGGSSAMPHKVNPVGAEVLVTLARFNATLVSGMNHAQIHEFERSGSAWTLEWMLLPQMAIATGAALRRAHQLVGTIQFNEDAL